MTGYIFIQSYRRTGKAGAFIFQFAIFCSECQIMMASQIHRIPCFRNPGAVFGPVHIRPGIHASQDGLHHSREEISSIIDERIFFQLIIIRSEHIFIPFRFSRIFNTGGLFLFMIVFMLVFGRV